jgi:hypothetical protein
MLSTACAESANPYRPTRLSRYFNTCVDSNIACLGNFINGIVGLIAAQPVTAGEVSRPVRPTVSDVSTGYVFPLADQHMRWYEARVTRCRRRR